jgi:PST family polysaccharide transporter
LSSESSHKQIFRSSVLLGSTQLITLLITFVRLKTIAILLGPAGVGLIGLYSAFLELMTAMSRLGVNESGVREIAASDGNPAEIEKLAQAIDRLSFFSGVIGWIVTVLLSSTISQWLFDSSQYASSLMILGAAVLVGTIASGRLAVIQGLGQVGYLARINIGLAIGGTTIAVLGYYWVGERGIVPVLVLTGLVQAALAWWYSRKLMPGRTTFSWAQTLETGNGLIKLGVALMYGVVLAALTLLAVRAIIVHFLGIEDSGFYQAAWSISGILSGFLVSAMSTDYYPRLAAVAEDNDAVNRLVNDQIEISALLATPGLVAATVLATIIVPLIYSTEFIVSSILLPWFLFGVYVQVLIFPMGFIQRAKSNRKWIVISQSHMNLLHIAAAFLLVPTLGLIGVVYAFTFSMLVHAILTRYIAGRLSGFVWRERTVRTILVSTAFMLAAISIATLPIVDNEYLMGGVLVLMSCLFSLRALVHLLGSEHQLSVVVNSLPGGKYLLQEGQGDPDE